MSRHEPNILFVFPDQLSRYLSLYKGKYLFHEPSADLDSWFEVSNWNADY